MDRDDSSIIYPSGCGRDRLEISSPALNEMRDDLAPVVTGVPSDIGRRIYLNGHDLRSRATLKDDDKGANATVVTAAFLAALNVSNDEGIPDIGSRNNVC